MGPRESGPPTITARFSIELRMSRHVALVAPHSFPIFRGFMFCPKVVTSVFWSWPSTLSTCSVAIQRSIRTSIIAIAPLHVRLRRPQHALPDCRKKHSTRTSRVALLGTRTFIRVAYARTSLFWWLGLCARFLGHPCSQVCPSLPSLVFANCVKCCPHYQTAPAYSSHYVFRSHRCRRIVRRMPSLVPLSHL